MGKSYCKNKGAASKNNKVIKIPADLVAQLDRLQNVEKGFTPTPVQVEILKKYYGKKSNTGIGRVIGVDYRTVKRWCQANIEDTKN